MSPKLRVLSGEEVIAILGEFGFVKESQRGSHVKLRRFSVNQEKQTLTVSLHKELDKGTLRAIMRQASQYIPEDKLREKFYTE